MRFALPDHAISFTYDPDPDLEPGDGMNNFLWQLVFLAAGVFLGYCLTKAGIL